MLSNLDILKKMCLREIQFNKKIAAVVRHSDEETRAKVLLLILDEGKSLLNTIKLIEKEEKRIRTKEEYLDPETLELVTSQKN